MTIIRLVARSFGWLLTPFVAWAASFLGAAAVASLPGSVLPARYQLVVAAIGGGLAAAFALLFWFAFLRRSPRLQETLQVEADGTPSAATELEQ